MQFFFYARDKAGAGPTRRALLKEHWAFMAPYIDAMIARGPTVAPDGKGVTGSMHIVDLSDAEAARVFAEDDPLFTGGVFEEVMVRRFENVLGRTMWQFEGNPKNPRFLFIAQATQDAATQAGELRAAQRAWLAHPDRARHVIVAGPLLGPDGERFEGAAMLLEAADAGAVEALLRDDPAARLYATAVLRPWRFGGAENLQDLIAGP